MSQQVIIFDTTLRDGEQALQASLSVKEKLQIALALERMGVDVMEVGFPVSSPGDFESVQTIARTIKNSRVCALARCVEKDIDVAAESLKVAEAFRIHTFIATSPMHIATKLRSTLDEVIERAIYMVKRARNYTDDVEFSCEDAGRTPIADLEEIFEIDIDEDDVDTVYGLLTKILGRVPIVGASAVTRGLRLTAVDSAGRRKKVSTIVVEPAHVEGGEENNKTHEETDGEPVEGDDTASKE